MSLPVQQILFAVGGVLLGFLLSIFWWWMMNHKYLPRIEFSGKISRSTARSYPKNIRYQMAVKNVGPRDALDVKIRFRIRIKDIYKSGGKLWDNYDIHISNGHLFRLKSGAMLRFSLLCHETEDFSRPIFGEYINSRFNSGELLLDDFFNYFNEVQVEAQIMATDNFSRGILVKDSIRLNKNDVVDGVFKGRSLDVVPLEKP